jgi:hypothetical protein
LSAYSECVRDNGKLILSEVNAFKIFDS